ncbi:MAG: hypothetical protein QGI35_07925 [Arenicellales bacterium]|jgi:threonine dehydrogenase-like Zn-dependent dehydrogenase|nr:hypothetical protein [Arenicellales bacterium]MDP6855773.1 hypothetical protein [Arenicellales bacterium]MDP6948910.1 hypothetical protein [Arenicellales bacterium]
MAAAVARSVGARHVVLTDRNEYRLELARKMDATRTGKMASLLQSGLNLSPIITQRFSVDDFQRGFDTMESGQSGKVILDWH